jgi:hypothetical protein
MHETFHKGFGLRGTDPCLRQGCIGSARKQRIDADAVRAELGSQCLGQPDQTMVVDLQGDTTWDITPEIVAIGRQKALELQDDQHNTDDLRYTLNAPKWVQNWEGPLYIEVSEQIGAFYEALDKKA